MISQNFVIFGSFILVLIIATSTMAVADESFLLESFSNFQINGDNPTFAPHGYIEDISWVKKVSLEGVIEIDGITFSIVNDDYNSHLFEICAVIEGPPGKFTPSLDSDPMCLFSEVIEGNSMMTNQSLNFSKGVKTSDIMDISIMIQEL